MKKIIIVCGIIAGLISISWGVFTYNITGPTMSYNMRLFFGYATMILGFSLIFVGVKNYRDNENGGVISFGQAFKISFLITLVASTVYVAIWMIDFYCFLPNFGKEMIDSTRAKLVADGKSAAEIQKAMAETANMVKMYSKPAFNALFTYIEILPPGIVISLIASAILKKKPGPATVNA